jgi:hypothetical protein
MKIRLNKSGGLIGKRMRSEIDRELSEEEWNELSEQIVISSPPVNKRKKDAFNYTIQLGDEAPVPIDPSKIPQKFYPLFKELFDALKPAD